MKMKKYIHIILASSIVLIMLILAGCGKGNTNNISNESSATAQNITTSETNPTEAEAPSENINHPLPPHVMVDGNLYKDTGYASSMAGCGCTDGKISSQVECTKLPSQDDQSNFGTDYEYQTLSKDKIVVLIDGEKRIFRNVQSAEAGIPVEVANFDAEVKEITEDGKLLVSFISVPDDFIMDGGEYYVPLDNLRGDVNVGDTVRIWYNGMIMETYPAQLGKVYRIEKIDKDAVDKALYSVLYLGYRETTDLDKYVKQYLNNIEPESIFISDGDVYLIIPEHEDMSLEIWKHNIETEQDELFYKAEECRPFLLHCNISEIFADATIKLEYKGEKAEFSPFISLKDGSIDIGDRGQLLNK